MVTSVCVHSEMQLRHRATASEEESKKSNQAQREAEAERRLAEKEKHERTAECLSWRERHQELADRFRAQEDLKALRQNKAVRRFPGIHHPSQPDSQTDRHWCSSLSI